MNAGPDYWYEARAVRMEEAPVKKVKPGRLLIAILFLFLSAIIAELAGLLVYAHLLACYSSSRLRIFLRVS